jgi:hypothetical protein
MHARHQAGEGCAGVRGVSTVCAARRRPAGTRGATHRERARDPVPEPPYVVGVVNLLALAVTLHANGPELAVSIDMFGIYSNVQARTSLSGTLPEKACDSLQAVSGYTL